MKKFWILSVLLLLTLSGSSQFTLTGVMTKNDFPGLRKGDTVIVIGLSEETQTAWIKSGKSEKSVSKGKIKVSLDQLNFWDYVWFKYSAYKNYKNPADKVLQEYEKLLAVERLTELESMDYLYFDPYLEDYLNRLAIKIHPVPLRKGYDTDLILKVLKSQGGSIEYFDNGLILLPTGVLGDITTEIQLIDTLAKYISYITLDFKAIETNPGVRDITKSQIIRNDYMKMVNESHPFGLGYTSDSSFTSVMSNLISYNAWQLYYSLELQESLDKLNRLIKYGQATEEEYLLKTKILRMLKADSDSNREMLSVILKAEQQGEYNFVETLIEKAVIYIRMEDYAAARSTLSDLIERTTDRPDYKKELKWAIKMYNKLNIYQTSRD